MTESFQKMDTNNDGRISWKEFEKCYMEYMDPIPKEEMK